MKALAGAIPFDGQISITGPSDRRVRLLFQDVSNQALLGAASLDWSLQKHEAARLLNELMLHDLKAQLGGLSEGLALVKTKLAMVAVRLVEQSGGLILDEPDWGLTRAQSLGFMRAVINVCEKREIPLLVITHRRWFDSMMRSHLSVERHLPDDSSKSGGIAMTIRVR
jgi:ABC-type branched-subunit amino acid transport system ATPase component